MRPTLARQKRSADSRRSRIPPYNGLPQTIPSPYGDSQATHPDVLYFPGGKYGYRYWMLYTPYPGGANDKENPSICASQDGLNWEVPPGVVNPIAPNAGGFNSDTDLVLGPDGVTFHAIYRKAATTEEITKRSSTDGVTWSAPTIIWTGTSASTAQELSPAIVWDGTQWVSWVVDASRAGSPIKRRTAPAITGPWSAGVDVNYVNPPNGTTTWMPWHINVTLDNGVFHMIVNEAPGDGSAGKGIRLASSPNGIDWTLAPSPCVVSGGVGAWDELPYRAAGVIREGGDLLKLWYGGNRVAAGTWAIGYTEIPASDTARYFPSL